MKIITESGSIYYVELRPTKNDPKVNGLWVTKSGWKGYDQVTALYPDRLPHFMASKSFNVEDSKLVCRNKAGKITGRFVTDQVKVGMILANPRGLKSTKIVDIQ